MPRKLRVLVVEDEMLVAMLIEDMLAELGHEVVGPAMRIERARELAATAAIDFALLDVNLGGARSTEVAAILRGRGVPFAFATGYGSAGLDGADRGTPVLNKPFGRQELERIVAAAG